jgi:alpha-N-arabinofuranosidase
LQALVLTEGDRFLLTPTYHVFDLYKAHQGATLLETTIEQAATYGNGNERLPQVSFSASEDAQGRINITLCNLDSQAPASVGMALKGRGDSGTVSGSTLTAPDMHAHNTFDNPDTLRPVEVPGLAISGGELNIELAPMSVTLLTIE